MKPEPLPERKAGTSLTDSRRVARSTELSSGHSVWGHGEGHWIPSHSYLINRNCSDDLPDPLSSHQPDYSSPFRSRRLFISFPRIPTCHVTPNPSDLPSPSRSRLGPTDRLGTPRVMPTRRATPLHLIRLFASSQTSSIRLLDSCRVTPTRRAIPVLTKATDPALSVPLTSTSHLRPVPTHSHDSTSMLCLRILLGHNGTRRSQP